MISAVVALLLSFQSLVIVNHMDCSAHVTVYNSEFSEGVDFTLQPNRMATYQTPIEVDTLVVDVYMNFQENYCGCSPHLQPYEVLPRTRKGKYFYQVKVPLKQFKVLHIPKPICKP